MECKDQNKSLKIGLYLQTKELYGNTKVFEKSMVLVRKSEIDILVFPEFAYFPFVTEYRHSNLLNNDELRIIQEDALEFSRNLGRAVVFKYLREFAMMQGD